MGLLNTILDIIFPVNCLSCGKSNVILCEKCLYSSPLTDRPTENWIYSIYDYRHPPIKKAIWLLKYKGKIKIAEILAESLYNRILEELSDLEKLENFTNPILIPIPLSNKRMKERGYNQSELIAVKIRNNFNNQIEFKKNILIKNKETEHQAKIRNKNKRLINIRGTFSIKQKDEIKNRNIILIDDVTTTGATLSEAKKILKENGAKKIIAFTIAH